MTKNSFVLYNDYAEMFDFLSNEEAGEMIKAIFDYATKDIKPVFHDRSLAMLFTRISSDMDRNDEKWEETIQARSIAGHNGGVISGERRRQKQIEANEAKRSTASKIEANEANEAKRSTASKIEANEANEANEAVNVNVNVNDNVNVNENVVVNVNEEETTTTTFLETQINKWCYENLKPCKKDIENKKEIVTVLNENDFDEGYLNYVLTQTLQKYPKNNITTSLILQGIKFEAFLIDYKKIKNKKPIQKKEIPKPPSCCPVCKGPLVKGGIPGVYVCKDKMCSPHNYYEYDTQTKTWNW